MFIYLFGMKTPATPEILLTQIGSIPRLERGTLSVLRQSARGPCGNFQRWENGRNLSQYVAAEQVPAVQQNLEAYARAQALFDQYVDVLSARSRAERLAEVKKKRPPRPSSSPRKPKSSR